MTQSPQLRPLGEALGMEALGIDLSRPLDPETFAWIERAFSDHPILVFREQNLGAPELAAFGQRFGKPRPHSLVNYRYPDHPEVSYLRNVDDAGNIDWFGVKRATDWHTDSTYEEELPLLAILHALEVPSEKGGTMFADMRAAYDALPDVMKERLGPSSDCTAIPADPPAAGSITKTKPPRKRRRIIPKSTVRRSPRTP